MPLTAPQLVIPPGSTKQACVLLGLQRTSQGFSAHRAALSLLQAFRRALRSRRTPPRGRSQSGNRPAVAKEAIAVKASGENGLQRIVFIRERCAIVPNMIVPTSLIAHKSYFN